MVLEIEDYSVTDENLEISWSEIDEDTKVSIYLKRLDQKSDDNKSLYSYR